MLVPGFQDTHVHASGAGLERIREAHSYRRRRPMNPHAVDRIACHR